MVSLVVASINIDTVTGTDDTVASESVHNASTQADTEANLRCSPVIFFGVRFDGSEYSILKPPSTSVSRAVIIDISQESDVHVVKQ